MIKQVKKSRRSEKKQEKQQEVTLGKQIASQFKKRQVILHALIDEKTIIILLLSFKLCKEKRFILPVIIFYFMLYEVWLIIRRSYIYMVPEYNFKYYPILAYIKIFILLH